MKGLFIINPSSGRQNFIDKIKEIAGMLVIDQICNTIDVFYTEKQDDALNKAAALEKGQYDFVVAVGGDGTLNEVINGVVLSQSNTPVAVISAGTVNDFATYLNLPQTPKEFCDMIADFKLKKVDVGKVNGKYFINVVAAGLLSDTGFKVSKDKKAVMGKLAYYLEGAAELPKQFGKSWKMKFVTDEKTVEEEILLFMVANSQSVGGFREIAPLASVSDGLFDIIIIKKMDIFQMLPLMLSILQGDHVNHPSVEYIQTKKLHIETNVRRVVFLIETKQEKDINALETVRSLFATKTKDFITAVDEKNIILVKEVKPNEDYADLEKTASVILDMLSSEAMTKVRVAYGTVVNDIKEVSRSYKEAKMALDVGKIFYNGKNVVAYGTLGIGRLIYQLPLPLCRMFIREIFDGKSPDEFDEETLTTINKFFENSLNVSETSRQLYIHRNTLVYRLDKLQKSTGLDLRVFEDAITFKIALMVVKYMKYMENLDY